MKNELRIGNLILKNGSNYIVDTLFFVDVYDGTAMGFDLQPIPLTEEILLKCGFVKVIVENFPIYLYDGFMIEIYSDNCVVCYNNSEITKIKFVHSLQNLYFSIKLKELLCDNI